MPTYKSPLRDYKFIHEEVLQVGRYANLARFQDASPELIGQILEEGAKFCEGVLAPLNAVGDKEGCVRSPDGSVTTPPGFKDAYKRFAEAGWTALNADPEYGGQGLPHVLFVAWEEMLSGANMAFAMYPGLSHGAYAAILNHGSEEQKRRYLPKMAAGEWSGTMNLTEPHCGTDLGMLRTKAEPVGDGSYKITGQKIFISAGEHDLTDNIIHLVLARIEGAPQGTKGISLFIVPKFLVNDDGSLGDRNGVKCGKIEEKMGIHGNATCVLNYDEAIGYLIGEENRGLHAMFTMMNIARLGVGVQGIAQAEVAYQNAAAYAKDRVQGRSLTGPKNPSGPADPIIVHPDVRRMLLDSRSFTEAARCFSLWLALWADLSESAEDEETRQKAEDYLALLTPVIKGYCTDRGYETASACQQVFGGHGYIEEWGMSQFVRDARITQIYEGANGIQALDLVGRKLAQNGGRAVTAFLAEIDSFAAENGAGEMGPFAEGLASGKAQLQDATLWLMQNAMSNFDNAGAASYDYMRLFGVVVHAYMWALMAKAAIAAKAEGGADPFYDAKLAVGRYFMARTLPEALSSAARLKTGAETLMALPAEAF